MATASTFQSDTFTFEVGVTKERFIMHKKAIEQHSQVLTTLTNNGMMQECTTGLAWLEHIEPKVFGLFAEYVYTGIYRIIPSSTSDLTASSSDTPQKYTISCASCDDRTITAPPINRPSSCPGCRTKSIDVFSVKENAYLIQRKRYYNRMTSGEDFSVKSEFDRLEYHGLDKDRQSLRDHLSTLHPQDKITNSVSLHALLYIFAQEYMVESLMQLCLHNLHRDLMALEINALTVPEIVKTLNCVYENTSGSNDKKKAQNFEQDIGQRLRNLVMLYAVWNAKQLLMYG